VLAGCSGRVDKARLNRARSKGEANVQICGTRCPPLFRFMAMTCLLNQVDGFVPPCARPLAKKLCPDRGSQSCFACLDKHKDEIDHVCKHLSHNELLLRSGPHCNATRPHGRFGLDKFFTPSFRKLMWAGITPNLRLVAHQMRFVSDLRPFFGAVGLICRSAVLQQPAVHSPPTDRLYKYKYSDYTYSAALIPVTCSSSALKPTNHYHQRIRRNFRS
jgi:hypothetical protein